MNRTPRVVGVLGDLRVVGFLAWCLAFAVRLWTILCLIGATAHAADGSSPEPAIPPAADGARQEMLLLPRDELFRPLIADVHWPRFSAEYQWRLGSDEFDRVGAVSFGETFAFVRSPQTAWGEWEFGVQANVDAIFDMGRRSFDLSNEDYFVGLVGSVRSHGVTTQLRISHTSAHLGDEYLIENGGGRDDVSFEKIDLLLSYEPYEWMRVYGGGGVLLNARPSFDPLVTEFGIELTSPVSFGSGLWTPIAGMDVQVRQQNDWIPDVALVTGIRLARTRHDVRRIEFVARYYNGRSPDGQFFRQKVESLGLGLRLGF